MIVVVVAVGGRGRRATGAQLLAGLVASERRLDARCRLVEVRIVHVDVVGFEIRSFALQISAVWSSSFQFESGSFSLEISVVRNLSVPFEIVA